MTDDLKALRLSFELAWRDLVSHGVIAPPADRQAIANAFSAFLRELEQDMAVARLLAKWAVRPLQAN